MGRPPKVIDPEKVRNAGLPGLAILFRSDLHDLG